MCVGVVRGIYLKVFLKYPAGLEIEAEGYSESVYHFEVPIMSEDKVRQTLDSTYTLKIKDLVIFKK